MTLDILFRDKLGGLSKEQFWAYDDVVNIRVAARGDPLLSNVPKGEKATVFRIQRGEYYIRWDSNGIEEKCSVVGGIACDLEVIGADAEA